MDSLLFLSLAAGAITIAAVRNNRKLHAVVQKRVGQKTLLPQAVSLLVITAQIPQLLRMLEHVSLTQVVASLFLLAIVVATRSGTESELH